MRSPKAGMPGTVSLPRWLIMAGSVALVVAGCSTAAATPSVAPTVSPDASVPPTPLVIYVTPTPAPTPTDTPAATPTAPPVVTAAPTAQPAKPTPTPLPALAIGLCKGVQLSLSITSWVGDPGANPIYAHVTATNISSASCNIRGSSEAQILNAAGSVIADAGSAAAAVKNTDPVYALAPNGTVNTIVQWGNWCKSPPTQNLKVAMVEPFGLGRVVAPANGVGSVPTCSGGATTVSSEAWLP